MKVELSSAPDTRTTPSDHQGDMRMVLPIASGSGSVPPPDPATFPLPGPPPPSHIAAPTIAVTPATPHGSQEVASTIPTTAPTTAVVDEEMAASPLPPPQPIGRGRGRSRTPAAALLGVEGRTTRARSRSKTPN